MDDKTTVTATHTRDSEYSAKQRLAEVNAAIQAVLLGGQSYKIGSRSLTRADLALLKSMRDDLEAQVAASEPSMLLDNTYVVYFERR